jgi:SAM-dependent methyltransferase
MDKNEVREHWNDRVKNNKHDLRGMVWHSGFTLQHDKLVRHILSFFKDKKVLDVGCGYGRFSDIFEKDKYLGFDISDEMVKLARELYPDYSFERMEYKPIKEHYDLVFQVISLGSMSVTEKQFFDDFDAEVIASFGPNSFNIKFSPSETDHTKGLLYETDKQ